MQKISNPRVVCFDVDETLIRWFFVDGWPIVEFQGFRGEFLRYSYDEETIKTLKSFKQCGYTVIVWSQTGEEWAEKVVRALCLDKDVDFVMSKPSYYVDDMPADKWMKWKEVNRG